MLIVCPSCASRYELDAAKLGASGRKVRCPTCRTQWHVDPSQAFPEPPNPRETQALLDEELRNGAETDAAPDLEPVQEEAEAPAEPAVEEPAPPPPPAGRWRRLRRSKAPDKARSRKAAAFAAAGTLGLVLLGLVAWQRVPVVREAPQLAAVFETLGLPVNTRGLRLTAVESGLIDDGQGRFLVVEGDVTNITRATAPMPAIEVAVKDAGGQTLYTWTTDPPRPALEPAELVRFRARLAAPPENGRSVQVRFTAVGQGAAATGH